MVEKTPRQFWARLAARPGQAVAALAICLAGAGVIALVAKSRSADDQPARADTDLSSQSKRGRGLFHPTDNNFGFGVGDGELAETARLTWLPWYADDGNRLLHHGVPPPPRPSRRAAAHDRAGCYAPRASIR